MKRESSASCTHLVLFFGDPFLALFLLSDRSSAVYSEHSTAYLGPFTKMPAVLPGNSYVSSRHTVEAPGRYLSLGGRVRHRPDQKSWWHCQLSCSTPATHAGHVPAPSQYALRHSLKSLVCFHISDLTCRQTLLPWVREGGRTPKRLATSGGRWLECKTYVSVLALHTHAGQAPVFLLGYHL